MNAKSFVERGLLSHPTLLTALMLLVVTGARAQVTNCATAPPGLVSWWRGENSVADVVGGNNGTIAGTGLVTYGPGVVGQAFVFDGTHRDRIDLGNPVNLQLQDFTLEAWVKRSDPTVTSFDVLGGDGSVAGDGACIIGYGRGGYILAIANDGRLILSRTDLDGVISAPLLTDTNWHHLAVTKDGTNAVFYVDGQPQATPPYFPHDPYTFDDTNCSCNAAIAIGSRGDARGGTFYGSIDEPAVFNRALSPAEIQSIYMAGSAGMCVPPPCDPAPSGLVAWWRAELDSNDAVSGHNGTPHSGMTFTNGEVGQAFSFDGTTNAYIEVPHAPELELTNEVTIEFWVKRQRLTFPGYPYSDYVIEKGGDFTGGQDNYAAALHNPQYNYCLHFTFAGGWRGGGSIADTNTWHHCAITARNGDTDPTLYIDGVAQPIDYREGASAINLYPSTRPLHIGAQVDPNTGWFYYSQVLLDELSVYNRVLSAAEIQAIYNAGSTGKCLPVPTPPTITSQPVDVTANAGTTANFNVGVNGTSPLYYQWYFNSNALARGTSQLLSLPNVTPDQAGTYFVVVSNAYGRVTSSNATLTVLTSPPTITQQPRDTNVFVGANLGLTVLASGSPTLTYQWQKDGMPLPGATTFTYRILNAQVTNSGVYSVIITNTYGSVTSSNATVTVRVPPPCVPPAPGLVSWWRAETNTLDNWDSNDGIGPSPVGGVFYGPGKVGQAFVNPRVVVPDSASLHITNGLTLQAWVNPTTVAGTTPYTIMSKVDSPLPGAGSQSSFWFGTTNNGLLYFLVSGTGSQRTNTALAGPALPTNQWSFVVATYDGAAQRLYVNGTLAAQRGYSGGIFPGNLNLGIGGVPASFPSTIIGFPFSGSIDEVCIYNRALTDSEVGDIYAADVSGMCLQPPVIVTQPQSQAIPLGEDVLFSVGVQGNRPLRYQWYFNSSRLLGATNSSLVLERIRTNQAGAYSVSVTNSLGFAQSASANLTLLPAPTCTHAPDGIISWWPANNTNIDIVGTNNATLFYPAGYVTGKVSMAFTTFTPNLIQQSGTIQVANSPSLNFGSNADFSIEAWVKAFPFVSLRPGVVPPQGMAIVQKRAANPYFAAGPGYALTLNEGRLAFWLASSTLITNPAAISSGPDLRDSMFHHVAVTLQRGLTNGGRLYVDGQLAQVFDPTSQRGSLANTYPLYIATPDVQRVDASLAGYVDELTFYNRALTADEIMAIRAAGAAGKCDHPPVLTSFLTKGLQDEPLVIPASRFMLFNYDPDGDPLSLFSVTTPSQNGRPVVLGTNQVTYTPASGYLGQDSFTYTMSDGHGGKTSATAMVLIEPRMFAAATLIAPVPPGPDGLQLRFSGYADRTYIVQRAESLEGPWTDLGTATTDADGFANFADSNPPSVSAYYRAVYQTRSLVREQPQEGM